jgi:tetratricopeptide (TPR) repeat protein
MRRGFLMLACLVLAGGLLWPGAVWAQQRAPEVIRGTKKVTPEPTPAAKAEPGGEPGAADLKQGLKYLEAQDYAKAIKAFQSAATVNPKSAEAYYYLGQAFNSAGEQDKAIKNLSIAVRLKPNFPEAKSALSQIYSQQGLNLMRQGNSDQAIGLLKEAVAQNPKNDGAYNNLGVALGKQGRYSESLAALQKAVAANPNNTQAQFNLGVTQYTLGDKNATVQQYTILTLTDPAAADELFRIIQGTSQVATPFRF